MHPILKKILKWVAIALVVLVIASLALLKYIGAWSVVFPSHHHDTAAPAIPAGVEAGAILVFSKTNSYRHEDAIPAGVAMFETLAEKRGWSVFHTENGAVFNASDLARFAVVVFHNVSGDVLSDEQQRTFQSWLESGGGWVGIHAAGDGSHRDWPWYVQNLIGVEFIGHPMGPQFQDALVSNEGGSHPVMAQLPAQWSHEEEWYSWRSSPRGQGFDILASIDENSYSPVMKAFGAEKDLHMGDHPVVWSRCVGKGRAIYSALGHQRKAYSEPHYQRLLENAVRWAMDDTACATAP